MRKWIASDEMEGLVDEKAGGIIGYIHRDHIGRIIKILNKMERMGKKKRKVIEHRPKF